MGILFIERYTTMLSSVMQKVQRVINPELGQQNADWINPNHRMTELETLSEAKQKLSDLCLIKSKDLIRKIQIVLDMDERLYPKLQESTRNYLKSLSNNESLKLEVEEVVFHYLKQLYITYTKVIVEYQQQNQGLLNAEKLHLLIARFLNAAFMLAKWRYFDDLPAPLGVWDNVHKIIRVAEELSIMNKQMFLYEFQNKETSLAAILERGILLDTLQKGSYTQVQIELTDRVLKQWAENPKITKQYTQQNQYQFFIHLEKDKRPQRVRGAKQHRDFRYLSTVRIVDLIEDYLCAVDTRKPLAEFNLMKLSQPEDIVYLFKMLRKEWCIKGYKRQRRDEERFAKFEMLNVSKNISNSI